MEPPRQQINATLRKFQPHGLDQFITLHKRRLCKWLWAQDYKLLLGEGWERVSRFVLPLCRAPEPVDQHTVVYVR